MASYSSLFDRLVGLMLVGWVVASVVGDSDPRDFCHRNPLDVEAEKTPGDNGFRIKIAGRPQPEWYTPGQVYTISISGTYPKQRFLAFYLVAVPQNAEEESTALGTFQQLDATQTKFSDDCFYVVTSVNRTPKSEVEVLWTAPASGTGCLEFRATVIETQHLWYKDDGALSRTLCEDTGTTDGVHSVEMLPECCACGTAKYQMTFHGLWSERTHPKDFPKDHQLLHWSNIVGASHSKHYTIWQFGSLASKAVHEICQLGQPQSLEEEMRRHSQDIRTVIKTPKIQWSDPHGLEQLRWAHFSVDRKNHLLSMLTRLGPSPDWCVGVSALNLCLSNCSWSGDVAVDLFPWDAGTDDGISYMSAKQKSNPPSKIQRVTNTDPADPASPFFGPESLKPMALLKLRRIHPKPEEHLICSDSALSTGHDDTEPRLETSSGVQSPPLGFDDDQLTKSGGCTNDWSTWSECSVSCGVGVRERTRMALLLSPPSSSSSSLCSDALTSTERCFVNCETGSDGACAVTQWSDWSHCGTNCNSFTGKRKRFRSYVVENAEETKRCRHKTEEEELCPPPTPFDCPLLNQSSQAPTSSSSHQTANRFSSLSSCSHPVDPGPCQSHFVRWHYDARAQRCLPFNYGGCHGNANRFRTLQECHMTCSHYETTVDSDRVTVATNIRTTHRMRNHDASVKVFQATSTTSSPSPFSTPSFYSSAPTASLLPLTLPCSDCSCSGRFCRCIVSAWSQWSSCSASCGSDAFRVRTREVKKKVSALNGTMSTTGPSNGSRRCTNRRRQTIKCTLPKCPSSSSLVGCRLSEWTEWSACAKTCGVDSIQERARHVLLDDSGNNEDDDVETDDDCQMQLIRRICALPPCPRTVAEKIPESTSSTLHQVRRKFSQR